MGRLFDVEHNMSVSQCWAAIRGGPFGGSKVPGPHLTAAAQAAQGDKAHCSVAMCKWDLLNLGIPAGSRAPQGRACRCRVRPRH